MAKTTNRFNPKSLARIQNMLAALAEAKAKGKTLTRQQLFDVLIAKKQEKDGVLEYNHFGGLIRDAVRLGHVGLKEIVDARPAGQKWEDWENKIVLEKTHEEAKQLLPHRGSVNISAQRYSLNNIKPTRSTGKTLKTPLTKEERENLRTYYPTMKNVDLQKTYLPTRSIDTIGCVARRMGLRKTNGIVPTMDPNKKIIEDILQIANARGFTAVELDKTLNANGYFKWNWKNEHRRLHLQVIERAARFLGLRLRLEALPEAPNFSHMVREWKAVTCKVVNEPKSDKPRMQKRAAPPRPSKIIGNHRPKDEIFELAESVVPRQHPSREDVIQDVWLAVYNGELSVEDFKTAEGRRAIRDMANASRRQNFEMGGFARSMDAPLGDGTSTLHDLIAAE